MIENSTVRLKRMQTEDLIWTLAANAPPVRRLAPPAWRAMAWLAISTAYMAAMVMAMGLRTDIQARMTDPAFVAQAGAAFITSALAATAAFSAGCPGRPLWERLTPLPALAVWLGSAGGRGWQFWLHAGPEGLMLQPDLTCFPGILLVSAVPGGLIFAMIQRGAPTAPVTSTALAALAAAALTSAALQLFHGEDANIMVFALQFGPVAILTGLGALAGRRLLRWPQDAP
jgi:hypothetical protein